MQGLFIFLLLIFAPLISLSESKEPAPVLLKSDTIFFIHEGHGHISAKERADIITTRIEQIMKSETFLPDSMKIYSDSLFSSIRYKSYLLMQVSSDDAQAEAYESHAHYAKVIVDQLTLSLQKHKENSSLKRIIKEISLVAIVVCMLIALIYFINKVFRWIRFKIITISGTRFKSIEIRGYTFVPTKLLTRYLLTISNILRLILVVLVVYLSLPVLFNIFPWSEGIADRLINYLIDPLKHILLAILNYIPNLLTIVVIFFFTQLIVRVIAFFAHEIETESLKIESFYSEWAKPTYKIIRGFLYIFMFIIIFPYLPGADSKIFQGVSVFLGVLISFGSSSAISNVIAGVALTYMRPYKIGDRVKINDVIGDITEKNLLVTRIRSIKNEDITVPNATILNSHTLNYTRASEEQKLILYTRITINYDIPWKSVHETLLKAAERTSGVVKGKNILFYKIPSMIFMFNMN